MIADTIKLLQLDDHYGVNEIIEIAKGRDEYITSWKDFKRKIKRAWRLQKQ